MAFSPLSSLLDGRRYDSERQGRAGRFDRVAPAIAASGISSPVQLLAGRNDTAAMNRGDLAPQQVGYEQRRVNANEAFGALQRIQDFAPDNLIYGRERITGIFDRGASSRGPSTTITGYDSTVTIRNGGVVSITKDGNDPILLGVTGDDSITIDIETGIATINR